MPFQGGRASTEAALRLTVALRSEGTAELSGAMLAAACLASRLSRHRPVDMDGHHLVSAPPTTKLLACSMAAGARLMLNVGSGG